MEPNDKPPAKRWTPAECPRAGEHLTPGQARYAEATGRDGACHLCGAGPLRGEPADDEAPSLDSLNADTEPPEVTTPAECRACTFGESMGHTCGRED